jgi:NTE family protein
MTTAWVLQGGASFGAAQVGMARALLEAGHHPDLLYGTSAGALNASWLATDPTLAGLEDLNRLWTEVKRGDVFPFRPLTAVMGLAGVRDHTVSSAGLARWLRTTTRLRRLEDGVLSLTVVATDIESGQEVLLDSGPAVPALLASSAMPGVFPPVQIGGRWLMDGSVASDTPIGPAVRAGATQIWVLPSVPTMRTARPRTALDVLLRSSSIMLARHNTASVEYWSACCELYVVPAPLVPGVSPFKFDKSPELIEAAYHLASSWLPGAKPISASERGGTSGPVDLSGRVPEL